ncbi:hypothetical protein FQZ97_980510 [compost metagenome]
MKADATVVHLHVPHHFRTSSGLREGDAGDVGLFQGKTACVELGEAYVLPGVFGDEIRHTAAATGRVHVHAIAWDLLEQLQLPGRKLARVLRNVVGVDAEERLVILELPVLAAHLAVAPPRILLTWRRPGWNHPIGARGNLPSQRR